MRKENKKTLISFSKSLNVKQIIKEAKANNLIKSHTEAFSKNPVNLEIHKGNENYL